MKINVTLELNDTTELNGLAQFVAEVEAYRNPAKAIAAAAAQQAAQTPPPGAGIDGGEVITTDAHPEREQVVATIVPGAPKAEELNQAALDYGKKHGLDKALELVRKFGVPKVSELKDPAKRLELYQLFQAGLK